MGIFIGTYHDIWEDDTNEERADMVAESLLRAAGRAGLAAVLRETCADKICMAEVVAGPTLDFGAVADVEASDASYEITIELFPAVSGERFSSSGAFADVLQEIEERAKGLFSYIAAEMARKADAAQETRAPGPAVTAAPPPSSSPGKAPRRKRIAAHYWWGALGITAALTAGWGALEITVHQRYKALERGSGDPGYWRRSKSLQIAARALFTAAATAAAATFVMLFLTDFERRKRDRRQVRWAPAPVENGGLFVLEGRF